jgi:hypothetical protein
LVPPLDNKYYILSEQGVTNLVYHYRGLSENSGSYTNICRSSLFCSPAGKYGSGV